MPLLKMLSGFAALPGHLLRRCHQIAVAIFLDECSVYDLTPLQFAVLIVLTEQGPQDQVSLGGETALDRTTITVVVRNLEERGLILRDKSGRDQRSKIVSITAAGQALLNQVLPAVQQAQDRIMAPLTPEEGAQLLNLLEKLAEGNNALSRAPVRKRKVKP
ncbi:MarR family winged helix-turn-helix transcriptional regulator [Thiothrix eikelboomii]|nr:MarR family transcriptional regulator [Thiothrix eikelboomii]